MERFNIETEWLNFRSAQISYILAESNRNHEKKPEPFTIEDFMPQKTKPAVSEPQDPNEILKQIRLFNASIGGKEVIT